MKILKRVWGLFFLLAIFASRCPAQPGPGGGGGGNSDPLLDSWLFSDTNWLSTLGDSPLALTNVSLGTNGDGNSSLLIDSTNAAYLRYAVAQSGHTNFITNGSDGSLTFWFNPSWSSADQGGSGPGGWGRLLEIGSFTTNAGNGWFSLYLSPDGQDLLFSTEDTNGLSTNVLFAPISWQMGHWHFIALNYSSTNSCSLYCDGVLLTNGPALSYLPGPAALSNGFAIGGDSTSGAPENQAHGTFDDLYTYRGLLDSNTILSTYNIFGLVIYGVTNFASAPFGAVLPTPTNSFDAVTGPGFLQWLGAATNVSTGGQVYITNTAAAVASNLTTAFQFAIAGGTNGLRYDVFATLALTGSGLTNSQWFWLGQGYTGNTYILTNQPGFHAFYVLGTPQDTDGDGLTDAYEKLVSHTDPNNPDTSYSGLGDGWYVAYGLNPLNPAGVPQLRLGYWRFNTNSWIGEQGQIPVVASNLASASSWSGNAVKIDTNVSANLRYHNYEPGGMPNINCANGSIRVWVNTSWNSGVGPGNTGRILEMGDGTASGGYWALNFTTNGSQIYFESATNNTTNTYFTADVSLASNTWHQIAITYAAGSNGASILYVDGAAIATGAGIASWPSASARAANGLNLGSSHDGTLQSRAKFDELETFNYPLTADAIAANYNALAGLNPVPTVTFTNNFVTNTTVTASITGAAAAMSVLVNSNNFASATWSLFATNETVNLGSASNGTRMVYLGFADMNGDTAWIGQHITVDTVPPVLTVTNPVPGTTNSLPMIQLQGYSAEPLTSLTYDLTNAAGRITNQPGFITDEHFDTNTADFTTNWFQCYDIIITNGLNTITLHATDRAGNTTVTNFSFTLAAGTNAPGVTIDFPTNGATVGADSFTLIGSLGNPTAKITATLVDASGNTNVFNGIIDRGGGYWIEGVPLTAGTNVIILSATDAWGNTTTSNVTVIKSSIIINGISVSPDSLFQSTTTVTGSVSDGTTAVWVNGVAATLYGDPTFIAANVPVIDTGKGTARFTVTAQCATGTASKAFDVEKPDRLYLETYVWNWSISTHQHSDIYLPDGSLYSSSDTASSAAATFNWQENQAGIESAWLTNLYSGFFNTNYTYSDGCAEQFNWPGALFNRFDTIPDFTSSGNGQCFGSPYVPNPFLDAEFCDVSYNTSSPPPPPGSQTPSTSTQNYRRSARSVLRYYTGGRELPGVMNLCEFHGSANHVNDKFAEPPFINPNTYTFNWSVTPIASSNVALGALGKLANDGSLYVLLPNNATRTVTPTVAGDVFYQFSATALKHQLKITANGNDLSVTNPEFCVGEQVTFAASLSPPVANVAETIAQWTLPPKFDNESWQRETYDEGGPNPYGSVNYRTNYDLLKQMTNSCWFINGTGGAVSMFVGLTFSNAHYISIPAIGNITVYRPKLVDFHDKPPAYATNAIVSGDLYLSLGDDNGHGQLLYDIYVLSKYTGKADIRQLINRSATNGTLTRDTTHGRFDLDNFLFYLNGTSDTDTGGYPVASLNPRILSFGDSPGEELVTTLYGGSITSVSDHFIDYVMFRPGERTAATNIYVPLGQGSWSWSALDIYTNGAWTAPMNTNVSRLPGFDTSDDFPVWTDIYDNRH